MLCASTSCATCCLSTCAQKSNLVRSASSTCSCRAFCVLRLHPVVNILLQSASCTSIANLVLPTCTSYLYFLLVLRTCVRYLLAIILRCSLLLLQACIVTLHAYACKPSTVLCFCHSPRRCFVTNDIALLDSYTQHFFCTCCHPTLYAFCCRGKRPVF